MAWFNPLGFLTFEEANYRTHRKVMVVDGDRRVHRRHRHRRPVAGPRPGQRTLARHAVQGRRTLSAGLEASFYENWIESGGRSAPALDPEPPAAAERRAIGSAVEQSHGWRQQRQAALPARTRLPRGRASTFNRRTSRSTNPRGGACVKPVARGVRVRLLVEGIDHRRHARQAREPLWLPGSARPRGGDLRVPAHHDAYQGPGGRRHFSLIGSANFGNRSFELNDELTVAAYDRGLAAAILRDFEADLLKSTRLDAATWKNQRSWFGKMQERFWSFFTELF